MPEYTKEDRERMDRVVAALSPAPLDPASSAARKETESLLNARQLDPVTGFISGTLSAGTKEFVGYEPSAEVQRWRAENPGSALASTVLGYGGSLILGGIALRALGVGAGLARGVLGAEEAIAARLAPSIARTRLPAHAIQRRLSPEAMALEGRSIKTGILRGGLETATVDATRTGLSAVLPDADTERVAKEAVFDMALGAGFGAAGASLRTFREARRAVEASRKAERRLEEVMDGFSPYDSPQGKLQAIIRSREVAEATGNPLSDELLALQDDVLHGVKDGPQAKWGIIQQITDSRDIGTPHTKGGKKTKREGLPLTFEDRRRKTPRVRRDLEALYSLPFSRNTKGAMVLPLRQGPGGLNGQEWDEVIRRLMNRPGRADEIPEAVDPKVLRHMERPTVRIAKTPEGSQQARNFIESTYEPAPASPMSGKRTWMLEDVEGNWHVAMMLKGRVTPPGAKGAGKNAAKGDIFLHFRTDNPTMFLDPQIQKQIADTERVAFAKIVEPGRKALENRVPVWRLMAQTKAAMPDPTDISHRASSELADETVERVFASEELQEVFKGGLDAGRVGRDLYREYLTPTMGVAAGTRGYAKALRPIAAANVVMAEAHAQSLRMLLGRANLSKAEATWALKAGLQRGTPLYKTIQSQARPGGIVKMLEDIDDGQDWREFQYYLVGGSREIDGRLFTPADLARKDGAHRNVVKALQEIRTTGEELDELLKDTMAITGANDIHFNPDHMMFSHMWVGTHRVPITYNDQWIGVVGGRTRALAEKQAKEMVELLNTDPRYGRQVLGEADELEMGGWAVNEKDAFDVRKVAKEQRGNIESTILAGMDDMTALGKMDAQRGKNFDEILSNQTDVFKRAYLDRMKEAASRTVPREAKTARTGAKLFAGQTPFLTKQEMIESVYKHIFERQRYMAYRAYEHTMWDELQALRSVRPDMAQIVDNRVFKIFELTGPATQVINDFADRLLEPFVGTNSASKISGFLRRHMFTFTLGFADIGYPAMNMVQWLQTVNPEVAVLLNSSASRLHEIYTYIPVTGRNSAQTIGVMDPGKLSLRAFKELADDSGEVMADLRWASSRQVTSPNFIDELGERRRIKELGGSPDPLRSLESIVDWLPRKSEELARVQAFLTGRLIFKEVFGLQGHALREASAQFVTRSAFQYSIGGRSPLLTGPVGGLFGQFKTWMMNYFNLLGFWSKEAVSGNFAPLLWGMGGSGAVAGLGGIPFYFAADSASRLFSDKPLMQNLYGWAGYDDANVMSQTATDTFFYGLPAMFGLSLQARTTAPGADIVRDVDQLSSIAIMDRGHHLFQALGEGINNWRMTGQHPMENRRFYLRMLRATAPRTLYRMFQKTEDNALRSLSTGNRLTQPGVTFPDYLMYALGISPLGVQKQMDASTELYNQQSKLREKIKALGGQFADAMERNDPKGAWEIQQRALLQGVSVPSVVQSGMTQLRNRKESTLIRAFDRAKTEEYLKTIGVELPPPI